MRNRFKSSWWTSGALGLLLGACQASTAPNETGSESLSGASGSGASSSPSPTGVGGVPPSQTTGGANATAGAGSSIPSETVLTLDEKNGLCGLDGAIEATNAGFTGSGYLNTNNILASGTRFAVDVSATGTFGLKVFYASPTARPGHILIDGVDSGIASEFPASGSFTEWTSVTLEVEIEEGSHELTLVADSAAGLANIDRIDVQGAMTVGDCLAEPIELPNVSIYIAGDSTVSTYTDTASPSDQAGWGQMLHEIFDARVNVINRAVGGRTALRFHLEGGTQWILDRTQPGDYWFIQFGTNDGTQGATFTIDGVTYPYYAAADSDFQKYLLDYYITPAREKKAFPVLITPPPRNSAYCGKGNSLGGYANAMRTLATNEKVLLLDNNKRTFDHLAAICPSPTPEDFFFVRPDATVDGTHFQENGARHMAGFLGLEMSSKKIGPYPYLLP